MLDEDLGSFRAHDARIGQSAPFASTVRSTVSVNPPWGGIKSCMVVLPKVESPEPSVESQKQVQRRESDGSGSRRWALDSRLTKCRCLPGAQLHVIRIPS